jgi:hypothetical protein
LELWLKVEIKQLWVVKTPLWREAALVTSKRERGEGVSDDECEFAGATHRQGSHTFVTYSVKKDKYLL